MSLMLVCGKRRFLKTKIKFPALIIVNKLKWSLFEMYFLVFLTSGLCCLFLHKPNTSTPTFHSFSQNSFRICLQNLLPCECLQMKTMIAASLFIKCLQCLQMSIMWHFLMEKGHILYPSMMKRKFAPATLTLKDTHEAGEDVLTKKKNQRVLKILKQAQKKGTNFFM